MGLGNLYNQAFMAIGGARGGCLGSGYGTAGMMFPGMNMSVEGAFGYTFGQGIFSMIDTEIRDCQESRAEKRAEKQKAKQAVKDDVDGLKTKTDEYNKLVNKSNDDIKEETLKANPSLEENVTKAQAQVEDFKNGKDSYSKQIVALKTEKSELEKANPVDQGKIDAIVKKINELEAEKITAKAKADSDLEAATTAKDNAIQDAKKAHEQAIQDKKNELKEAQTQTEEDVSKVHQISKKCDDNDELKGIILKEDSSNKDVTGKLSSDDLNNVSKDNAKNYARAFNYQFGQYCSEQNSDKKKTMAANAKLVYDKLKAFEKANDKSGKYITPEMEQNMKIMESGQRAFGL